MATGQGEDREYSCVSVSYKNTKMARKVATFGPSKLEWKGLIQTDGKNKLKISIQSPFMWQMRLLIVLYLPRVLSRLVLMASRKSDVLT